ncbi:DUF1289 domain-containing protein [Celerinatantimonas sp. YJH-8]|uniref:DUF1289 domain-containing protein n=1 Tax=Celerinatantimonas sp. YJH-8 TaxID=3228714 RepID=UPI0038C81B0D
MQQLEIFPLQSPCLGICEMNEKGLCRGCFRTREERFAWSKLSPDQQRNVIRLAHNRKVRYLRAQLKNHQPERPSVEQTELPLDNFLVDDANHDPH